MTNHSLPGKVARNTFSGIVAKSAQIGTRLITIPIVIAHLGMAGFGIWSIIMTTAAYMRFGSVGIKSAFQKYVAEATGNANYDSANRLLSTGCAIMSVLSVLALIPMAVFSDSIASAIGVPREFLDSAGCSIRVLALIMVMSNVGAAFEAIVMGGHRIDIARNLTTIFTVAEAVAIVLVLHLGCGLLGMACVMAASELGFVICCYFASLRVVPQIKLRLRYISRAVVPELVRYAGSYQLVNVLEIVYGAIVPITVLHAFGADTSGVYAIATRLSGACLLFSEAFLAPILSAGTMVFASGSAHEMRTLISKSFKTILGLALLPLAFTAVFGTTVVYAWIGQTNSSLPLALSLVCLGGFFQAFSLLGLVLYRVSGLALMDNIRQGLRIVTLLCVSLFASRLGFYGVLGGLALAELIGMSFMLFALMKTFRAFRVRSLIPDALKLTVATAVILAIGLLTAHLPLPGASQARLLATFQICTVFFACLLSAWPVLRLTNAITSTEGRSILGVFSTRLSHL